MLLKNLKLSIAICFSTILVIGMFLISLVVISFWQQYIVSSSINHLDLQLLNILNSDQFICDTSPETTNSSLKTIEKKYLENDTKFFLYKNDSFVGNSDVYGQEVAEAINLCKNNKFGKVVSTGNFWSLLSFEQQYIIVVRHVGGECGTDTYAGVVLNMANFYQTVRDKYSIVLVYILVNTIILSTIGFFRMLKIVIKPLENLVYLSDRYKATNNEITAIFSSKNEFKSVATTIQNMILRIEEDNHKLTQTIVSLEEANQKIIENQKTLVEAEKFAAIGKLSAGIAHEIGNPLGIIQGYLELLGQGDYSEEEFKQYIDRAGRELDRVTLLIKQLLNLAREKPKSDGNTLIYPVIMELVEMLNHQSMTSSIEFKVECYDNESRVSCTEDDLHQVVLNILLNAIDAVKENKSDNPQISLSCFRKKIESKSYAVIEISDNGVGISVEDLSSVFDPFFTTKQIGEGTGLGLSVSRSIIEKSSGKIQIVSSRDSGTSIIIMIPVIANI